jgi:SAM-dependent methyltransferase
VSRGRASDRISWAVDQLAVQPDARVLDLGCGHGVATALIGERLRGGVVVGLDRSEKMIAAAAKRNAAHAAAGRARFVTAEIGDAGLGNHAFDNIVALRFPPLLRGRAGPTLSAVRDHLVAAGALHVVEHPLTADRNSAVTDAIVLRLREYGLHVDSVSERQCQPGVCVVGRVAGSWRRRVFFSIRQPCRSP